MASPPPQLVRLADRILEQEARGSTDDGAPAAALERACERLRARLIDLLGTGGISALLRRSLHMAQREQPLLGGVVLLTDSGACFSGLQEALSAESSEQAMAAAATVLAYTLDLLIMLLGEELGMKPIRTLWPDVFDPKEIAR